MNRYTSDNILTETNGPRYYGSVKYPSIAFSIEDSYIITMNGDRLDNLAYQFYQDPTLWWVFQIANNLDRDSLYPPVGMQLRIPADIRKIIRDFEALNS